MIRALALAVAQLSDPSVRRVLWLGILGAILLFAAVFGGLAWTFSHVGITGIGWLDTVIELLGGAGLAVLSWMMFPAVVIGISGLLVDGVVGAVERRHYPGLPAPRQQGIVEQAWLALRFFVVVVALNLVALPIYLAMPPLAPIVFYLLNGYLLGREYFEAVAFRRLEPRNARVMRRAYGLRLLLGGMAVAFLSTLPLINLLVPVLGTAFMTHVFHGIVDRKGPRVAC